MVKILTDSAADVNQQYRKEFDITAVPLSVIFGEEVFEDEIDITREEFYHKLVTSEHHPTTSHPMPIKYQKYFEDALKSEEDIIHFAISSKISGCYNSASMAVKNLDTSRIHVIDTRSVSMGTGLLAVEAAKMSRAGYGVAEIIGRVEQLKERLVSYIAVNKVKYLHKSGRMTMTKKIIVDILDIKPILSVRTSGIVDVFGGVRGEKKALKYIAEQALTKEKDFTNNIIAIGYTGIAKTANDLIDILSEKATLGETIVFEASPVIGAHIGPGCAGVFYINKGHSSTE